MTDDLKFTFEEVKKVLSEGYTTSGITDGLNALLAVKIEKAPEVFAICEDSRSWWTSCKGPDITHHARLVCREQLEMQL